MQNCGEGISLKQEINELERKARNAKLPVALIVDRGLTEIPPEHHNLSGYWSGSRQQSGCDNRKIESALRI